MWFTKKFSGIRNLLTKYLRFLQEIARVFGRTKTEKAVRDDSFFGSVSAEV